MTHTIGIDISLTSTAIALFSNGEYIDYKNIKTQGKKGDGYDKFLERIRHIAAESNAWIGKSDADEPISLAVIEAPSHGSKFGNPHERAGLWWAIYSGLATRGIKVATVAPKSRAKYITGSGNAGKPEVVAHAIHHWVHRGSPRIPNDDVADAVGMADMAARLLGYQTVELPEVNKEVLFAVRRRMES